MENKTKCAFCSGENCLTTLGQYCLCAACYREILQEAMDFAKRNTVRGTLYHAAFAAVHSLFTEDTEIVAWEA